MKAKVKIYPYRKWKKGSGKMHIIVPGGYISVSKDTVRKWYYRVLGLDFRGGVLDDEIDSLRADDRPDVDMPEDILKIERVMDLRGE